MTQLNLVTDVTRGDEAYPGQREINVTLSTVDRCEGQFTVTLAANAKLSSSRIVWSPQEPDKETETAEVCVLDSDRVIEYLVVDGDVWRELESQELDDELWARVLSGEGLEDALASMPIRAAGPRM